MNELYSPGLHVLLTLQVSSSSLLTDASGFIRKTEALLVEFGLEKVGVSQHTFDNNSFTIAYCLKESHICVHTWPEFGQLTLDVYLCNYLQDNGRKVRQLADAYVSYFSAAILKDIEIER
ncbi:MAG TPA: S-adenosylmethionine decarboxylase [Flavobacterium sp.]|nr:S-adenosylmethionine decarboxylase [Flavobacterium sp.]